MKLYVCYLTLFNSVRCSLRCRPFIVPSNPFPLCHSNSWKLGPYHATYGVPRTSRVGLTPVNVVLVVPCTSDQLGDLDRVARIVKLNGYVQCVDGYTGQPTVVNGASDLLTEVRAVDELVTYFTFFFTSFRNSNPVPVLFVCKTFVLGFICGMVWRGAKE